MEANPQAYIVTREAPRIAGKEPVVKRWAMLTMSAEAAVELVRMRVGPECVVTATDEALTPDAVSAIGLKRGHATAL